MKVKKRRKEGDSFQDREDEQEILPARKILNNNMNSNNK